MRYDPRIVEQVQTANDIGDIIGQYVSLKRSGKNLKACCPFHSEKTPSFMVQPEKQIFHCFGCAVGGDVFSFIMRQENMTFPEAIRFLADRARISLPAMTAGQEEGASDTEKLYQIYQEAAQYFRRLFVDPVRGKVAREYFLKRKFDMKIAEEIQIGWAPDEWRGLSEYLSKKGFPEALLLKSGLIARGQKGHVYDAFRGRLLFPICNLQGKTVAFGGRALVDGQGPKYLNSPENPIFHKRRELFGLHLAKKNIDRDRPELLVTEGYFDFLRLYNSGIKNVVATLGTALTDEHVQLLKRFVQQAVVVYDGDKAGEAASLRGLEVFLEGGLSVMIVRLPAGFDPDDFVAEKGPEAFRELLSQAQDFFDYKLENLLGRFSRSDSMGLMRITNEFLETFAKIQNPVMLDRYLRRLAGSLGVEENSLRSELLKLKKKIAPPAVAGVPAKPAVTRSLPEHATPTDEEILLYLAAEETRYRQALFTQVREEEFTQTGTREIFRTLMEVAASGQPVSLSRILSRVEDSGIKGRLAAAGSLEWKDEEKAQAFKDCLDGLRGKQTGRQLEALRRSIAKAEQEGDQTLMSDYMRQYQALWRESKTPRS